MEDLLQQEIERSLNILKKGKVLLYPTDTVWGLGCDATNSKAVQKIFKIKNRQEGKSMIVLLASPDELEKHIKDVPPIAYDLIANAHNPLTIIYPRAQNLAKNLIAPDGTIAIRVIKDEFCTQMIERFGKPVVSTSANLAGDPAPPTFYDIDKSIIKKADYSVQVFHDRLKSIKPSTIIRLSDDNLFEIIRP